MLAPKIGKKIWLNWVPSYIWVYKITENPYNSKNRETLFFFGTDISFQMPSSELELNFRCRYGVPVKNPKNIAAFHSRLCHSHNSSPRKKESQAPQKSYGSNIFRRQIYVWSGIGIGVDIPEFCANSYEMAFFTLKTSPEPSTSGTFQLSLQLSIEHRIVFIFKYSSKISLRLFASYEWSLRKPIYKLR